MVIAQFVGMIWGCLVTPSMFSLLKLAFPLPGPESSFLPGPYGPIYRTLAIVATGGGFGSLPKHTLTFAGVFIGITILVDIFDIFGDPAYTKWIPEPTAMAIGMLVGPGPSSKMFIGCLIKYFWTAYRPEDAKYQCPYIAAGCLTGSGIAVVCQALMALMGFKNPVNTMHSLNSMLDQSTATY